MMLSRSMGGSSDPSDASLGGFGQLSPDSLVIHRDSSSERDSLHAALQVVEALFKLPCPEHAALWG